MSETATRLPWLSEQQDKEYHRLIDPLPWETLKALSTIKAHAYVLYHDKSDGDESISDLAALIVENALDLVRSLTRPQAGESVTDAMIEAAARAMKPSAFDVFERGYTCQNIIAETAFLNAEKNVKRARKDASIALRAALSARAEHSNAGEGAVPSPLAATRPPTPSASGRSQPAPTGELIRDALIKKLSEPTGGPFSQEERAMILSALTPAEPSGAEAGEKRNG